MTPEVRAALGLILLLLFVALTCRFQRRHREEVRRRRRAMWDLCVPLLEQPQVTQDDVGFPVLRGVYRGSRVTLEPFADHVALRKLPQLWLRATVFAPLPVRGSLDYLARPENIEFYSGVWSLPTRVPIPSAWPQHAVLRTDGDPETCSSLLEVLSSRSKMLEDASLKELVLSGKGVRMVVQLGQAERARYAVFRSVHFDRLQVPAETADTLMNRMLDLVRAVEKAPVP